MTRYLFRVQYTDRDGATSYEPVCVRAEDDDEDGARAQVVEATSRFKAAIGGTTTIMLIGTAPDA